MNRRKLVLASACSDAALLMEAEEHVVQIGNRTLQRVALAQSLRTTSPDSRSTK
jgi:hypothetical protein